MYDLSPEHCDFQLTKCSHHSAIPRRSFSYHCYLRCRWRSSTAQPLFQGTCLSTPCIGQHNPPFRLPWCHSYSRVVSTSPSSPQLHPLDYLQRQPSSCDLRSGTRYRRYRRWSDRRHHNHSQQRWTWLEGPFGNRFHDWCRHSHRCMERDVRGKYLHFPSLRCF